MAMRRSERFDAIIVGSGFGGSVSAARLAGKGMNVLILERGPWWGPLQRRRPEPDRREFPRGLPGIRKLMRNLRVARHGRRFERLFYADGLLETHCFDHLNTLTASGVGGGSHIYTSILEEPPPEFFDEYPDEITAEEMHPYFDRVREVLKPAPIPEPVEKSRVFREAVSAAGLPVTEYPDLAIAWGKDPKRPEKVINSAGIEQFSSTFQGDAFVGCEDGSKTTLDLTYISIALRYGAELRPLSEVLAVGAGDRGYWVHYHDHRTGEEKRESAPRLILAAGGLNTQRLLFDARDGHGALPKLPMTLGQRFSANGDLGTLLWKTAGLMDSSRGPTISAICRIVDGDHRFLVGEAGIPAHAIPVPGFLRRWLRRSTFLFSMGRGASTGTIRFDGTGLITSIGRSLDPILYDKIGDAATRVARYYQPKRIFANVLSGRGPEGLLTVHPLGGCPVGRDPRDGFADHRGEVFGHPGLFVADGSLYPASPGIAPSMTIAALAERQADLMK